MNKRLSPDSHTELPVQALEGEPEARSFQQRAVTARAGKRISLRISPCHQCYCDRIEILTKSKNWIEITESNKKERGTEFLHSFNSKSSDFAGII